MKYLGLLILSLLIVSTRQQIQLHAAPSAYTAYVGETSTLVLDGNANVINGADWLGSFTLSPSSPSQPTWASNDGLTLTFSPSSMSEVNAYTMHYLVQEKGTGSCTATAIIRKLSLSVTKRPPQINYDIPDDHNLRAAVPFEVVFPQAPCIDPLGLPLSYSLLDYNNQTLPTFITLDMANNRVHGTVPNSNAGGLFWRLFCKDTLNQATYQDFVLQFRPNNAPHQNVPDLTPYTVIAGEGASSTHVIPTGKPIIS